MSRDVTEFLDRARPLGVLYVDVYPCAYVEGGEVEFLLPCRLPSVVMPGQWKPVCGKIGQGESIAEAFHHQVMDKAGAPPLGLFKIDYVNTFYDEDYDTVMFVLSAACEVRREVMPDARLHDAARFVRPEQLAQYGLFDGQLRACAILQSALNQRKRKCPPA